MDSGKKQEGCVGTKVVVRVIDVLAEGEAWLARTRGIGRLSGSDIVFCLPICVGLLNRAIHQLQQ